MTEYYIGLKMVPMIIHAEGSVQAGLPRLLKNQQQDYHMAQLQLGNTTLMGIMQTLVLI